MKTRGILLLILSFYSVAIYAGELKLWYAKPARTWEEALPLGNAYMGANGLWRNRTGRITT